MPGEAAVGHIRARVGREEENYPWRFAVVGHLFAIVSVHDLFVAATHVVVLCSYSTASGHSTSLWRLLPSPIPVLGWI